MRKVMLMAAVMAMVLAAAAPAFAQANAVGGNVQYVDCDQIQAAVTGQYNVGNDQDQAGIAQELGVSQNQVSACLDSIAAGEDVNIGDDGSAAATTYAKKKDKKSYVAPKKASVAPKKVYAAPKQEATATATVKAASSAASAPASAPAELPSTGGPPALALGAAVLLLAGGLLARRIVR